MYPQNIEQHLNDSNILLTERRRLIANELRYTDTNVIADTIAELIIRVNMLIKVTRE
jgi:hypothetical protein